DVGELLRILLRKCLDDHEPICVRQMQVAKEKSRGRADDRRVCANTDRKRNRRDRGKSAILSEHSKAVTDVLMKILQPVHSTFIAALFLEAAEISESAPRM